MKQIVVKLLTLACGVLLIPSAAIWAATESLQPSCLDRIGVRQVHQYYRDLTGWGASIALVELPQTIGPEGVMAFVPDVEHHALAGARLNELFYAPNAMAGYSQHASAIAGILFGNDPNAWCEPLGGFSYQGIVPNAAFDVYEANWFIFHSILARQNRDINADVVSISWGSENGDFLSQWWQRGIDSLAQRQGCTVVAGCGNGTDSFISITQPSSGYNVISVGSACGLGAIPQRLEYFGPPRQQTSSFGPTDDGRAKPDCVAPGIMVSPSLSDPFSYEIDAEGFGYSSYAAPQVAGIAALLIDAARQYGYENGDDPRVIKALILNGANKLTGWHKGNPDLDDDHTAVLDRLQGAGLVNAWNAFEHFQAGRYEPNQPMPTGWDFNTISFDPNAPDSVRTYDLGVTIPAGQTIKATLCWYRRYQQDRFFTSLPLARLALELWAADETGQLMELLDVSESANDNLQHIYYTADKDLHPVLVVLSAPEPAATFTQETYALAFTAEQANWPGDQFQADFNADGLVDVRDLEHFLHTWNRWQAQDGVITLPTNVAWLPEDLNSDGRLDRYDFQIFSSQWQQRSEWYSR